MALQVQCGVATSKGRKKQKSALQDQIVRDTLQAAGFRLPLEVDGNEELEETNPLKPTMRKATSTDGSPVVLKLVDANTNELKIIGKCLIDRRVGRGKNLQKLSRLLLRENPSSANGVLDHYECGSAGLVGREGIKRSASKGGGGWNTVFITIPMTLQPRKTLVMPLSTLTPKVDFSRPFFAFHAAFFAGDVRGNLIHNEGRKGWQDFLETSKV
ncbi:hypothetical protein B0F90DRAFT_1668559 [Multifurca ochricompacta]|uniref:Uncharacterized protein n=1 Tax=Multifurca ochricompacta TaxID=376703 RepID=A0AAD4M370_9AGAM|nr:hypothetical protein B0F90DRAFT_1668559 [Multifurca ochricompacta]